MKRKNITRSALFTSIISLLLCISMLAGTTFAWFTDSVKSGINTIAAGVLDVELYHSNAAVKEQKVDSATQLFLDLQGDPILWEPGVVSYENLRVANEGDLALAYQLAIQTANENYIVDPSGAQYGLSQILKVGVVPGGITATTRDEVVASVADAQWTTLADFLRGGALPAAGQETWGVVIYWQPGDNDNLWNLNNGKTLSSGEVLQIDLGVKLVATQEPNEFDSFSNQYDENAKAEFFPGFQGGTAAAAITADDQGVTSAEAQMAGGDVSAVVPAGVQVAEGTTTMTLSVTAKDAAEANIQLSESEEMRPLDVHIEGVAAGNTTPMLITLKHYLSTGINTGALRLYHVENGATVAMTQVAEPKNHNEFSYDPATGDLTLAMASFSEVATAVDTNNPWDGETKNYLWYDPSADELTIYNADQLAGFADIVDGKAEGIAQDSFKGKTVKLANNVTLSGKNFDPIGWGYDYDGYTPDGKTFNGTFDGNNKFIFDLKQNGWELGYSYSMAGGGLFASVVDATIKNVKISGADIRMECIDMGVLVGLSQGNCTYENIEIYNSKIANYQRSTGGVVGEVTCKRDESGNPVGESIHTFTNVKVHSDVVVGTLWGDFDASCGGVIGGYWDDNNTTKVMMDNVDVRCRLDVYNDITAAYQWHAYRRAGMLIGNTDIPAADGRTAQTAKAPFLTCTNVSVAYGDWKNYTYCQFTNDNNPGKNYPWVRVQAGENCDAYSNPRYGHPVDISGKPVVDDDHTCTSEHQLPRPFGQLYGGGQGVYGADEHTGVDVVDYKYSITYMNDNKVLDITYVTDNANAATVGSDQAEKLVLEWAKENIKGGTIAFGGWMNAASIKLTEIPEGNTKNVVLYPYFNSPYTASFVDQQGQVLSWCLFNDADVSRLSDAFKTAKENLPALEEDFELINWQIRGTNLNDGKVTATLANDNTNWDSFKGYKDVTITPKYTYNGVELIEVIDELTGEIDHYQAAGYGTAGTQAMVKIPGEVNGAKVTEINGGAFKNYDGVHSIVIPDTVTYIGDNALAEKWGTADSGETVTIYYEGSYDNWVEKERLFGSKWESGISGSSRIFFLNGGKTVDASQGYLQAKVNGYTASSKTVSWTKSAITLSIINEYTSYCDCSISTKGDTGHIYVDASGNVMGHNDAGTPVNANGKEIYFDDGGWFGDDTLTDGSVDTYKRYRPDKVYWKDVTV